MKKMSLAVMLVLCISTSAFGLGKKAYQMKDDFGMEMMETRHLQYYYYIPCPTYSWFWGFYGWAYGDIVGQVFRVGDTPTGGYLVCDSVACYQISGVRVLDFAGYGTAYPGLFTVEFDVYCADDDGCPIGPSLWNSGPYETGPNWNDVIIDPPLDVSECYANPGPPESSARFLVTATHTGTDCAYPQWGLDNISTALQEGCDMHVFGCLPALYPRPYTSNYGSMASGYYGIDFEYCPPQLFADARDTSVDGSLYGFIELSWRVRIECEPNAAQATTWGNLKALYR